MGKNVLIAGGAGYVGQALTNALENTDHTVRVYDLLLYDDDYRKDVQFVRGDVRDCEKLLPHIQWADTVVWLAALVGDGVCDLYSRLTEEINTRSVAWLVDHYDGRIIFPSTSMVYGVQNGIVTEDVPLNPVSLYAQSKAAAERHLQGKNVLIVRLGTLYGLAHSRIRFDLVVNLLTMKAVIEKKITVFGGSQVRSFLHVGDVARVMADHVGTAVTGVFNLHSESMTVLDMAKRIQTHVPDAKLIVTEKKEQETGDYILSSDRARQQLGFSPVHTLNDGIGEVRELVASGRVKDPFNPKYSNVAYLKLHPLV